MMDRRRWLGLALGTLLTGYGAGAAARSSRQLNAAFRKIHKRIGGRLGVHVLDTQTNARFGIDQDGRYAMASTFKLPLAAALLWQVDRRAFPLTHALAVGKQHLLTNSPVVEQRLAQGESAMTVRDLCAAVVMHSDNAAANILLGAIGGPQVLTQFLRALEDNVTRLDRAEPEVNTNAPGDVRDTTTPRAMVDTMAKLLTGDALTLASRALLIEWLTTAVTGRDRLRAGFPQSWTVGDKTGTGANAAVNDLAIAWPPQRKPVLVAVYMSESKKPIEELKAAHKEIGAAIAEHLSG